MLPPDTIEKLQAFLKYAKTNHIPFFVLGNGSNVIFSDTEYEGVIIKLDKLQEIKYQGMEYRFLLREICPLKSGCYVQNLL